MDDNGEDIDENEKDSRVEGIYDHMLIVTQIY